MTSKPLDALRHHVTGAIERGEAVAVVEQRAATHTPGPWAVDAMGFIYASADSELPENSNQGAQLVLAKLLSHSTVRTAGNASLIAAAPDLLAALEQCLTGDGANCLAYGTDTPSMRRRFAEINRIATEAIRKAKGE